MVVRSSGLIKLIVTIIACSACVAGYGISQQLLQMAKGNQPNQEVLNRVAKSVVRLIAEIPAKPLKSNQLTQPGPFLAVQPTYRNCLGFAVAAVENWPLVLVPANEVLGAQKLTAILSDGRIVDADVYAIDELLNIALIRVSEQDIPLLKWADGERLEGMTWGAVFSSTRAIAGAINGTVQVGATAHEGSYRYLPIFLFVGLNTSGAIGSPVINEQGRVVGVLSSVKPAPSFGSMIHSKQDTSITLAPPNSGYAVPSSYLKVMVSDLRDFRRVRRPWVGMSFRDGPEGAVIVTIARGSPCEKAGLKVGDKILFVDGKKITNGLDLAMALSHQQFTGQDPTIRVTLKFIRSPGAPPQEVAVDLKPNKPN